MIIAIYGISRSGKDFLIDKLISLNQVMVFHVKGSTELETIAKNQYNKSFHDLPIEYQENVRSSFTKVLKNYEKECKNVIVDGHYAFPDEEGFQVVYTEDDYNVYDAVFYLNRSEETIKKQTQKVGKHDRWENYLLNDNNVRKWMDFEIEEMILKYSNSNKDFFVLDENVDSNVEFILKYLHGDYIGEKVVDSIVHKIMGNLRGINEILLTDLDKTISVNDATYDYIMDANLDIETVKEIFNGDYYTGYQFFHFHKYLQKAINCKKSIINAAKQCVINRNLLKSILKKRPANTAVIGITTGIADMWHEKNKELNLFDLIIGKSYFGYAIDQLITKKIKGSVANCLREYGYDIVSLGDSKNDLLMMANSSKSFIICNSTLDEKVKKELESIKINNIFQPSYNIEKYENIAIKDEIW